MNWIFGDEKSEDLVIPPKRVGKGHCKVGKRKQWTKRHYFALDLLKKFEIELGKKGFQRQFAGYNPQQIQHFFDKLKKNLIREKETKNHARNKLLMWIDRNHNKQYWHDLCNNYKIGISTAKGYVKHVEQAIFKTFRDSDIISFPSTEQRKKMVQILKQRGAPMPNILLTLDGKHARCTGLRYTERLSWKFHWKPCFNCLFIVERVFGTVCAFNLDESAKKHDITVLRESDFLQNVEEILNGWYILADNGYEGIQKETNLIIPAPKLDCKKRKRLPHAFWKAFRDARNDSERIFGHVFYNKFPLLGNWPGKSKNTFVEWCSSLVCCIILYNYFKIHSS